MSTPLTTLHAPARHAAEIRKSRFLAQAAPVADADAAAAFVREVSATDATHHCWAWRLGAAYRFSDDGEPGGTAGQPILRAIEAQGCDRVAVVVSRWYGGIKLGTGGLARAYGGTAAECLRLAERVAIVALARLAFEVPFAELALVKARLAAFDAELAREDFAAAGARLEIRLPEHHIEAVEALLTDLSRGRIAARRLD